MAKGLLKINAFYVKLEAVLAILSGILFMVLMLMQTASVASRALFSQPLVVVYDLGRLLFVSGVFLGVSYVQGNREHIRIEMLTDRLPHKAKYWFELFGYLLAIMITSIIVWQTGLNAWNEFVTKNYTMGIVSLPLWPAHFAVTFGVVILWFRLVLDLLLKITIPEKYSTPSHSL